MDLTYEAFKMAGALAVVVLMLLGGLAWVRRTFGESPGLGGDPVMRVLGGLRIGAGKHIMLVDVAGEVLVLGTTAKDVTLLTKITDEARTGHIRAQVNPVASRIGTWMERWAHPNSEKTASSSLVQASPVRITKC